MPQLLSFLQIDDMAAQAPDWFEPILRCADVLCVVNATSHAWVHLSTSRKLDCIIIQHLAL